MPVPSREEGQEVEEAAAGVDAAWSAAGEAGAAAMANGAGHSMAQCKALALPLVVRCLPRASALLHGAGG